jgi:hypothetical protein
LRHQRVGRLLEPWRGVPFSLDWLVAEWIPSRGGSCKCFARRGRKRPMRSLSTQGYVQRHCFQFNPPPSPFPFSCAFSAYQGAGSLSIFLCVRTHCTTVIPTIASVPLPLCHLWIYPLNFYYTHKLTRTCILYSICIYISFITNFTVDIILSSLPLMV